MTTDDGIEITDPDAKIWYIIYNVDRYPRSISWATFKHVDKLGDRTFYSSKAAVVAEIDRKANELWEEHGRLTEWTAAMKRDISNEAALAPES